MSQPDLSETAAATDVTAGARRGGLRRALWVMLGALAVLLVFAVALIATLPVATLTRVAPLPPQVQSLAGTLWQGRAALREGYVLTWTTDIEFAALTADLRLSGADTQLAGQARVFWRGATVEGLTGRAGPGLLNLLEGTDGARCTMGARFVDVSGGWLGAAARAGGRIDLADGRCETRAVGADVPAMTIALGTQGRDAVAEITRADGGDLLGGLRVTGDRRAILRVEQAGAALVPGMPASGPSQLEYPF
ncbi:hypothetical protein [Sulfitobacter sabulilitoris]|nr:hypothetical protein [Sulfitobacter sabulilitoris]